MGRCWLGECVLGGGGLDGHFGEEGLAVGIKECLELFHRGIVLLVHANACVNREVFIK